MKQQKLRLGQHMNMFNAVILGNKHFSVSIIFFMFFFPSKHARNQVH